MQPEENARERGDEREYESGDDKMHNEKNLKMMRSTTCCHRQKHAENENKNKLNVKCDLKNNHKC